jgi:ribonuclease HI
MNLLIAKAYRTTSSEALCILAGTTPIIIKAEEGATHYDVWKGHRANTQKIDREVELNQWSHPADFVNITETNRCDDQMIRMYTDSSKGERGVRAGVVIFVSNKLIACHKFKLNHRCSNNQTEQLAIIKALDLINYLEYADNNPRTIGVYTDSRITIDSLRNASNHNYLIEEIRKKLTNLRSNKWTIEFSWIKAHAGNFGNELADHLAKEAASNKDIPVVFDRIPKTDLYSKLEEEATLKWQEGLEQCNKAAVKKQFFPNVQDSIHRRIKINQNFTALITGHGKPSRTSTDLN